MSQMGGELGEAGRPTVQWENQISTEDSEPGGGKPSLWHVEFEKALLKFGESKKGVKTFVLSGLLSNTWKWIIQGDTRADKARDFIGTGHLGREQEGERTQEDFSPMLLSLRFDG